MYQLFKHPGSHPLTSLRLNCSICQFIKSATCMTASNRHAPKGCIHPANLAKHLLTFHNSRHSLEEIQHQIDRLALNYPPHEGPHPLVPFFPGGILPPAIPGVAREIGFYCTICRKAHKGDKKAGYARLITHLQQGAPLASKAALSSRRVPSKRFTTLGGLPSISRSILSFQRWIEILPNKPTSRTICEFQAHMMQLFAMPLIPGTGLRS